MSSSAISQSDWRAYSKEITQVMAITECERGYVKSRVG